MEDIYLKEFEKLNSYQREAVISKDRYVLLNAVVGSGKTTVLTHKVLYLNLIEKVPIGDIVVLTFTNKAAREIKDRVSAFSDGLQGSLKYFGTFHSVSRTILSESLKLAEMGYSSDFQVIDTMEAADILLNLMENSKLKIKYKAKILKRIEEFKNGKLLYGAMKNRDEIEELYRLYTEEKIKRGVMDFDDLIIKTLEVMDEPLNPRWIIVDEFQDTDERQLELIKHMAGLDTNIFVVGDPNQIIYSWRTGASNIFEKYKKLFKPVEFNLPINYRSSKTIIEAANAFLGSGKIEGIKEAGNPIIIKRHYDSFNEALHIAKRVKALHEEGILYRDIAVLYRRQAQLEVLSEVFLKEGINFKVVYKGALPFEERGEEGNRDAVNMLTMHSSKGLEFSHVFITGVNMGNIPLTAKRGQEEEEARLFFVALTRAKNYLEISYLTKPSIQGMTNYPSPYISMIPKAMAEREDEVENITLKELVKILKEEKEKKNSLEGIKRASHVKYGTGIVIYEDENVVKVEFDGYGEKEFSKMFCPLTFE